MFIAKITRNRERVFTWHCPLDAVRVAVIFLMLITLKPKSSRPLEISSASLSGGEVTDFKPYMNSSFSNVCYMRFSSHTPS
jgi:hypothetical protein